jgi:ABC-type antimicrobial peptide transport system permease subunit
VTGFRSVDQQLQERLLPQRFNAAALNLFAAFAVLLAAMGIYGSVAFAVGRRTREIGIRMALGADTRSVLALVMHNALLLATGGILLGLGGAFVITRVLRPLVSATSTSDPRVFAGATVVIAIAIVAAAALPARRAARVDAVIALRGD